ncbi:MAG: hypothetical protein ACRDRL_03065 [Sciscionella sp.]
MASVVSALIAAVVAMCVALLGHWQWRRQQAAAAADRYRAERADALKELWDKLNDHSTAARIARLDSEQFYRNLQDLNFFLIRKSLFLTEPEKDLARLYLESIYAFRIKVEKSRDRAAYEALVTSRPLDEVGDLTGALTSGQMVQEMENRLVSHIKDALEGKSGDIDIARLKSELLNAQLLTHGEPSQKSDP